MRLRINSHLILVRNYYEHNNSKVTDFSIIQQGIDGHFTVLISKAQMEDYGWNVEVDYHNVGDKNKENQRNCGVDTFYGYKGGNRVGSVSAAFKGSGKGLLQYGNCYKTGFVVVSLNDIEIDRTKANAASGYSIYVSFQYKRGDVIKIEEQESAIIKWTLQRSHRSNWEKVVCHVSPAKTPPK